MPADVLLTLGGVDQISRNIPSLTWEEIIYNQNIAKETVFIFYVLYRKLDELSLRRNAYTSKVIF